MLKEWFARYNWEGLSLLGFAAIVAIGYLYKVRESITGKEAVLYFAVVLAVFALLYLLGLRW